MAEAGIECVDCGRQFECYRCKAKVASGRAITCTQATHDTAARVGKWTVWRGEHSTMLCPFHRTKRGIKAWAWPLEA